MGLAKSVSCAKTGGAILTIYMSYDVFLRKELIAFSGPDDCICVKILVTLITARRNARIASAVLATGIPSVCLSVCPSLTRRYCQNNDT